MNLIEIDCELILVAILPTTARLSSRLSPQTEEQES